MRPWRMRNKGSAFSAFPFPNKPNPMTIKLLQKAVQEGDYGLFKEYSSQVNQADLPHTLRGLLELKYASDGGIPLSEVESADSIVKRFKTGAMSYGSISEEAHECMAIAMNRTVTTEPEHYQTNVEKVFTAGDMHRGQSLVVWAIAEGRAAAAEVDEYLMGYTNLR